MKMFQIQFHTGFVPRNATTVKFAKYVHNFEKCYLLIKIIDSQSIKFLISCSIISTTTDSSVLYNSFSIISSFPFTCSPIRYDLDACDIQEKYPDLFQVNLDIEVEPRDRPSTKTPPWEGFQTKGLNPKILFSSRDEQQEILSKFGRWHDLKQSRALGIGVLEFAVWFAGCLHPSVSQFTYCIYQKYLLFSALKPIENMFFCSFSKSNVLMDLTSNLDHYR